MRGDYNTLRQKLLKYAPALAYLFQRPRPGGGEAISELVKLMLLYPGESKFNKSVLESGQGISASNMTLLAKDEPQRSPLQLFSTVLDFAGTPESFIRIKAMINQNVDLVRESGVLPVWFELYRLSGFEASLDDHTEAVVGEWNRLAEADPGYALKSSRASQDAFKNEFFVKKFADLGQVLVVSNVDEPYSLRYNIRTALPYGFLDLYIAWLDSIKSVALRTRLTTKLREGTNYKIPRGGSTRQSTSESESSEPKAPTKAPRVQPSPAVPKTPVRPSPAVTKTPDAPPASEPPRRPSSVVVPPRPPGTATGPPASRSAAPRASLATARSRATAMSSAVARAKVLPSAPLQERPSALPSSGGVSKTVARLRELNAGLLQREAAFPTLLRLQSIMDSLVDTCYGERWRGVYEDPQAGLKSDYGKKTLLTGLVRFVRKPAGLPLGDQLFLKGERYIDLGGGPASDEVLNEIAIGTRLNMLIEARLLRGFVRLVDWYLCRDNWTNPNTNAEESIATAFTLQEVAPERLVDQFLQADEATVVALMANLLLTLETAQDLVGYVHYDMHLDNVHVASLPADEPGAVLLFQRPNGEQIYLRKDVLGQREVKLIDYGRNRIKSSYVFSDQLTEVISMPGLLDLGIGPHFDPYYDMRLFAVTMATKKGASGQPLLTEPQMEAVLALLNEASGHRYVAVNEKEWDDLHGTGEWSEHRDTLQANAQPEMNLAKTIPAINKQVTKALTLFRDQGLAGLARQHAVEMPGWAAEPLEGQEVKYSLSVLIVAAYWVWSSSDWPGLSPEGLLDLPVFDALRRDPGTGPVEPALQYRSISTFKRVGKRV